MIPPNQQPLRLLASYHFFRKIDLEQHVSEHFRSPAPDLFVDSGGFSAATQGAEIKPTEYADWLHRNRAFITVCANLDVIGDPEATWANQQRLEDAGLSPLPVFHAGSPWHHLERYLERYPYIALGGMVPHRGRTSALIPWLVQCFRLAEGTGAGYHGFGVTSWEIMSQFPWYSVDSTTWNVGAKFGEIPLFDTRRGKFTRLHMEDRPALGRHAAHIRDMGFRLSDFTNGGRDNRHKVDAIGVVSYRLAEQWLRRKWGEIRIPSTSRTGLRLYLAAGPSFREKEIFRA